MPKSLKISLLAVSVVFVLCLFLGVNTRGVSAAGDQSQEGAYRQINVYGEVLQHIQNDYVEDPNIPAVTNGALRGLLESLDADSSYLTPADYKTYKEDKGGKAQVGINVSKRYGYATVVSVVPGSPADKANLNDGDIIEAIGNQDTRDLSLAMIQLLLEGAPGSELDLAVIRPRQAKPQKVVAEPRRRHRAGRERDPVRQLLDPVSEALHPRQGARERDRVEAEGDEQDRHQEGSARPARCLGGRRCRGDASGQLLPAVGHDCDARGAEVPEADLHRRLLEDDQCEPAPLAVLVNRGTAGPAEIVAAAIADNKRGDLVGERTFGEGIQQKTFELPDGGAIILSVAKYASPKGKKFEDDAVTPATLVASNLDLRGRRLATLTTQRRRLQSNTSQPDDQLSKALEMLKAKAA